MIPIDIQVCRSKVKVKGHAYSSYVGEGAFVFYKQLYLMLKIDQDGQYSTGQIVNFTLATGQT